MYKTITLKRNDDRIALRATLLKPDGTPEDLTGATVKFIMSKGSPVINRETAITDEKEGGVMMVFTAEELASGGLHKAEFEAAFPDGRKETYPNDDYLRIHVIDDLG